jgi:hypothetical protein
VAATSLQLASSRAGDVVALDASDCEGLPSANWTVASARGRRLWRRAYGLGWQAAGCSLRVGGGGPGGGRLGLFWRAGAVVVVGGQANGRGGGELVSHQLGELNDLVQAR